MRSIHLILFLFAPIFLYAQAEHPSKANEPKAFSLNPDDLGALENSVNLFTGQVAFPMSIAGTPGRGGLGIAVNIMYNSNVKHSVGKRNADSPTGILGLGWSLDVPRIVADHKLTGTRNDDQFYLVEGGQSKKLVCLNNSSYPRTYEVKSSDLWRVQYYPFEEKWVVTRENGFKYVFGDQNSNRGTVQWMVRWGNWIGNSVLPVGQQQHAYIWNISEVENLWGEKMRFAYENVEEFVASDLASITTQKKHTKASYLKSITDPAGYSVELLYGEKVYDTRPIVGAKEYEDPHNEKPEPDAYQEKFETRYLDRVIVNNHDGSLLYETDLEYSTRGLGTLWIGDDVKRLLTSVKKIYPSGRAIPPTRFEYFSSGDFTGCLKKVTNAYGAYYEYTYDKNRVPFSDLDIAVDAPTPGQWKEHYVYPGNDYVIVVWRTVNADGSHNAGFRPCKIWLYSWDGKWSKRDLTEGTQYGYINLKTRENDEQERVLDWQVVLGDYFFSYMYQNSEFTSNYEAKIWYKKESTGSDWNLQSTGTGDDMPMLLSGDDFVAISNLRAPIIKTYVFNGDGISFMDIDGSDQEAEYFLSATNNYIFVHNDNGGHQDYIHVFHLSPDKKWVKTSAPSSQLFNTDGDGFRMSYWHSFNSFSLGLPWDNEEFIYMWDENYTGIRRLGGWGRLPDDSFVISRGNSLVSTVPRQDDRSIENPFFPSIFPKIARYNGSVWQFAGDYGTASHKNIAFGNDFSIHDIWATNPQRRAMLREYDPNIPGWKPIVDYNHHGLYLNTREGANRNLAIEATTDAFVIGDGDLYQRNFKGTWHKTSSLKLGSNEYLLGKSLIMSPSLIAYEYSNGKTGNASGSYLALLKNGRIDETLRFSGKTFDTKPGYHIGNNLVVHVDSDTRLVLRKVIDNKVEGRLYVNHIATLRWYDGNRTFRNAYDFDFSSARLDPGGQLAYFNKVGVIQGSPNTVQRPFGHTDYYFFNGLKPDSLASMPLNRYSQAYNIGVGEIYETCIVNAEKDTVGFVKNEFTIFDKFMKNTDNKTVDVDFYLRPTKRLQMVDGVLTETTSVYQEETGLLDYTYSRNSTRNLHDATYNRWIPASEQQSTYFTYWWEIYDPQRTSSQWLSDVVQVYNINNSYPLVDTVSSVVTRWKTWENGRKAPDMIYSWLRKNTVAFPAWNAPAVPPTSDWKVANVIKKRDLLTGAVLESQGASGLSEAVVFDDTRTRMLASAVNASHGSIAFTSFEAGSKGNWIFNDTATHFSDTSALTGRKYFRHATDVIESQNLAEGTYTVSLWAKGGTPQITATTGSVVATKTYTHRPGWTLYVCKIELSATGKITVQGGEAMIDELRLHPFTARMTSYTHNAFGSVTSEDTPNHLISYFTFDDMNRPHLVKDQHLNIIKRYDYHYRDEEEYLTALLQYKKPQAAGIAVEFSVTHPVYSQDTVTYTWYFGDGTELSGTDSVVTHAYASSGFYEVLVIVRFADGQLSASDMKVVHVPESLVASAKISSGSSQVISCPQNPNTIPTNFSAAVIRSGCEGYTYTWYYTIDGAPDPVELGSGPSASHTFTIPGQYAVFCKVSNSCGQTVDSSSVTVTVEAGDEYCGIGEQN